jgi:hypothetical protein
MLNSELTLELARTWAERLVADYGHSAPELIRAAYRAAYSRAPADEEIQLGKEFLAGQRRVAPKSPNDTQRVELSVDSVAEFCHALFNSNEFIMVD